MKGKAVTLVLWLTAIYSIVIPILGRLKFFSFFEGLIPSLTLFGIGLIAGYLVLEQRERLEAVEKHVSSLETRYSQVGVFLTRLMQDDSFAELKLMCSIRAYAEISSDTTVAVDRTQVRKLWRDCIGWCHTWYALSYVRQDEAIDTAWGKTVFQGIQKERISAGASIKRVFVIDNDNEYQQLLPEMTKEETLGIEIRWLTQSELMGIKFLREATDVLGTIDFAVVDGSWVFRTYLNKQTRECVGGDAVKEKKLVEHATRAFNEAFFGGNRLVPQETQRDETSFASQT